MLHQTQPSDNSRPRRRIRLDTPVCACHGEVVRCEYAADQFGVWRERHRCPVDGLSLGFDGGVPLGDYERCRRERAVALACRGCGRALDNPTRCRWCGTEQLP